MKVLEVIEAGPDAQRIAKEREEYWIEEYLPLVIPLLNIRGVSKSYPRPKKRIAGFFDNRPAVDVFQDLLENMPATLTELARRSGVS